jgi:hypothetical protein
MPGNHKTPQKTTFRPKPLSMAQLNAIEWLMQGHTEQETGDQVGVNRETVWHWRKEHPIFMAALEQRRSEVWRQAQERLRAMASKACENIAAAVESGSLKASFEVLKAIGIYGVAQPIGDTDPQKIINERIAARLDQECPQGGIMHDFLTDQQRPGWHKRKCELEAQLLAEYGEEA